MDRLKKVYEIAKVHASEVECSRIGIGFEKLDRNVFNPDKAYDPVAFTSSICRCRTHR